MSKNIIALRGRENSGKSGTIWKVKELIPEFFPAADTKYFNPRRRKEVFSYFIVNGVKIGIVSIGDIGKWLTDFLNELKEKGCTIIICAIQIRDDLVTSAPYRAVQGFTPEFKVKEIPQEYIDDTGETIAVRNERMARKILGEVDELLSANH